MHNCCTPHIIKENFENFLIHRCNYILLSQGYCVRQVVKTLTIILITLYFTISEIHMHTVFHFAPSYALFVYVWMQYRVLNSVVRIKVALTTWLWNVNIVHHIPLNFVRWITNDHFMVLRRIFVYSVRKRTRKKLKISLSTLWMFVCLVEV